MDLNTEAARIAALPWGDIAPAQDQAAPSAVTACGWSRLDILAAMHADDVGAAADAAWLDGLPMSYLPRGAA